MRTCLGLATALAACGAPAPAPEAPGNANVPAAEAFLVWTGSLDEGETVWFDPAGEERGRAPGLWVADGERLWQLERVERTGPLAACETMDDEGSLSVQDLRAVPAGGGAPVIVIRGWQAGPDEQGSIEGSLEVVGGLGAQVFAIDSVDAYACGAHGNVSSRGVAVDVGTGESVVDVLDHREEWLADGRRELQEEHGEEADGFGGEPQLGAVVPAWQDGSLIATAMVFVDACYACGNGEWSSYTIGTWVTGRAPAAWHEDLPPVPAAARELLAEHPGASGLSWGRPGAGWNVFVAR